MVLWKEPLSGPGLTADVGWAAWPTRSPHRPLAFQKQPWSIWDVVPGNLRDTTAFSPAGVI